MGNYLVPQKVYRYKGAVAQTKTVVTEFNCTLIYFNNISLKNVILNIRATAYSVYVW
jgi:hypothetical protein